MNRAERRRVGNVRVRSLGQHYRPGDRPRQPLEQSEHGHEWMVLVTYRLSERAAYASAAGEEVLLDAENVSEMYIGCYRCEQPVHRVPKGTPCPGARP